MSLSVKLKGYKGLQLDRYFNFENAVKVFFAFSILFALSIPYLIEGDFIYEIQGGNFMILFDMLGPLPEALISDTFTLDLMFWEPRGIEFLVLLLVSSLSYIAWYKYTEYGYRMMLCERCGEQNYSKKYFFSNPEDDEYVMCLDCYYEVYGKFESEYEKVRVSPEEKTRWEVWGKRELTYRKAAIAYRKQARKDIEEVVQKVTEQVKELRDQEDKYSEDYTEDYEEDEEDELEDLNVEEFN